MTRAASPRSRLAIALMLILLLTSSTARACPFCESETAEQVREQIVDDNLGTSIIGIVLPFVLVAGIVTFIHFGPFYRGKR